MQAKPEMIAAFTQTAVGTVEMLTQWVESLNDIALTRLNDWMQGGLRPSVLITPQGPGKPVRGVICMVDAKGGVMSVASLDYETPAAD